MTDARSLPLRRVHGTRNAFYLLDVRGDGALARLDFARVAMQSAALPGFRCDGLLVVRESDEALAAMRMFNPDGSEAEMCGNGMRCVARHLAAEGGADRFMVASLAGPVACEVVAREPFVVRIDLGPAALAASDESIAIGGTTRRYRFVSLGNPHAVVPLRDLAELAKFELPVAAEAFAHDARFPQGVNVHAVAPAGAGRIAVRHFERGAGETASCGTGAVASAVVAIDRGLATSPVTVDVAGGTLVVTWTPGGTATLAGPAVDEGPATLAYVDA